MLNERCLSLLRRRALQQWRPGLITTLGILLVACGQSLSLPERPVLLLEAFPAPVQAQIRAAEEAVGDAPDNAQLNGALAMILHAYAERQWAEVYYHRAQLLAPGDSRWAYLRGVTLAKLGRAEEALDALRQSLVAGVDEAPARLRMAALLLDAGELDAAQTQYGILEVARPDSARVAFGIGRLELARGNLEEGIRRLERAAKMESPYGAAHFELISAYRQSDRLDKARQQTQLFEKFRGREPPWDDPVLGQVSELNQSVNGRMALAQRYLSEQRLDKARSVLDGVLEIDPQNTNAHALLIVAHGALGNDEQAQAHYETAVAIAPDTARLHSNLGVLRLKQERLEDAAEAFSRAIEVDPDYATGYVNLGAVREKQGRNDVAMSLYRDAIARAPANRQAHYFLGRLLVQKGRMGEAIEQYMATLEPVDERTPWYLRALAGVYIKLGRYQDALDTLTRARDLAEGNRQGPALAAINSEMRKIEALTGGARTTP